MDLIDQPSWAHAPSAPAADASVSENVRERETFKYVPPLTAHVAATPPHPSSLLPSMTSATPADEICKNKKIRRPWMDVREPQ